MNEESKTILSLLVFITILGSIIIFKIAYRDKKVREYEEQGMIYASNSIVSDFLLEQ